MARCASTRPTYRKIATVFKALQLGTNVKGSDNSKAELIDNAGRLIATAIVGVLVTDDGSTADQLEASLRARQAP